MWGQPPSAVRRAQLDGFFATPANWSTTYVPSPLTNPRPACTISIGEQKAKQPPALPARRSLKFPEESICLPQ
jgi:hypothetical protein